MNNLALSFLMVHSLGAVAMLLGTAIAACFAGERISEVAKAPGRV
jgi:hypothetical protein